MTDETASAWRLWRDVWGEERAAAQPTDLAFGRLRQAWIAALADLPGVTAAVELGAGAAAEVSRLVLAQWPTAQVTASDFRPLAVQIPGVSYVTDAAMEALPFADAAFDLATAQFAFEYAQRAAATAQLARVLAPGGSALLVMHCRGAYFDRYLPHRLACLEAGAAMIAAMGARTSLNDTARLKLKGALRRIETQMTEQAGLIDVVADLRDFLDIGRRRLSGQTGPDPVGDAQFLAACAPTLALARAQAAATLSEDQMPGLMTSFTAAGFERADYARIDGGPGGAPLAWMVRLRRA